MVCTVFCTVQILLNGSSRDPSEAVRHAARAALSLLPITAASLAPLLADFEGIEVGLAATPAASVKTRKRAKSGAAAFEAVEQIDILQLAGDALFFAHGSLPLHQSLAGVCFGSGLPAGLRATTG